MSTTSLLDLSKFRELRTATMHYLGTGTHRAIEKAVSEGEKHARTNHVHKKRTGFLTRAPQLYGRVLKRDQSSCLGEIGNTAFYARWIEEGTKPHWIRPKEGHGFIGPLKAGQSRRAKDDIGTHRVALRWYVNGQPVFARAVFHPGTAAMPFMVPAGVYAKGVAIRILEERFTTIGRELWG